ncbi:MAG: hypothetical protein KDK91_13175 [Gammaproteobacteria bacterium]|nr:hypothetical protein [Gammaproteobacteria bacterium]
MRIARPTWVSLGWALLWTVLVVSIAVGINLVGIGVMGDIPAWTQWLDDRAGYFFAWRLCLYGVTVYGWLWMRRRLYRRDPSSEARQRLLRAEIGAIAALVLLEVGVVLRQI